MRSLLCLLLLLTTPLTTAQLVSPPPVDLPDGTPEVAFPAVAITMTTPTGRFPLLLELAMTPEQSQRGLMFRPDLPDDYGMLFVFNDERQRSFWMENTPSPLDLIFIRIDGVIDSVAQGTPLSRTSIVSDGPARFVLEMRQGLAQTYGLVPGATVTFE